MASNYKQLYENNNGKRESFYPKSVGEAIVVKEGNATTLADFYNAYSKLTELITNQNNTVALKGTTVQYRCFASSVLSVKDLQSIQNYAQDSLWGKTTPDITKALPNLWKRTKNSYTDGTEDENWNYSLQAALSANSYATQAVYKLVADGSTPTISEASGSTSNEGFIPEGWQRNQPSLQKGYKIWRSERNYITDLQKWSSFSNPAIWAVYPESGTTTIISRDTTTIFGSGSFFVDTSAVTATFNYSCNVSGYYVIAFLLSNSSAYFVSSNNSNTDANSEVSLIFKQGLLSSSQVSQENCTFTGLAGAFSFNNFTRAVKFGWGVCTYATVTLYKDSTLKDILWEDVVTRTGMDGYIFNVGDTSLTSIYSYLNAISTLLQTALEITATCSSLSPNIVKGGACHSINTITSNSTINSLSTSDTPSGYYIAFTSPILFTTDSMDQSVQYQLSFYGTEPLTCKIGSTPINVSVISNAGKWCRYGGSFTLSTLDNSSVTFTSSSSAQISSVQIEKGSIITDWKDYGTGISSVILTAQSQISTFSSQLDTLLKSYNSIKNTAEGTQQIVEGQLWDKDNNSIGTALSNSITNAVQTEVAKLDTSTGQSSEWKLTALEISLKINSYAPNLCKGGACTSKVINNSWIKSLSGQFINSNEVTDASSVTYSDDGAAANITNSISLSSSEVYEFPLAITVPGTTAVIISFWYYSTSEETSSILYGWGSSSLNSPSKVIKDKWTWCTNIVITTNSDKTSLYLKGIAKIANVQVEIATFQKLNTTTNTLAYVPSHYHEYGSDYGSYTINTIDGVKTTVTNNTGRISLVELSASKVESTISGIAGNMCLGAACDSNAVNNYYISYCETSGVVSVNPSEWQGATVSSDSTQLTSYVVLKKDESTINKIKFKVNPFISGQTYIISFYAKCDSGTVQLQCNAAVTGNAYDKDNPGNQYITVDTTWKRYALTLVPTYKGDNPSVELLYLVLFFKDSSSLVNTSIAKMLILRGEILNKWQDYGTDELSLIRLTAEDITLLVANTALSLNADGTIVANVQGKTLKSGLTITKSGSTFTGKVAADTFALTNLATSFSPAENEVLWFTTVGALQSQFPNESNLSSDTSEAEYPVMVIKSNDKYYFTKLTALGTPNYIPESNLYNLKYDSNSYHVTVTKAAVFTKTENSTTTYYLLDNGNYTSFTGSTNYFYKLLYTGYVLQKSASEVCYVTYGEVYLRINYGSTSLTTQSTYITLFKEITISSTLSYSSSGSSASTVSTVTTTNSTFLGRTGTLSATFSDYYVSGGFTSTKNNTTISITNYCTSDTTLKNSFNKETGGYYSKSTDKDLAQNSSYYIYANNTWNCK